MSDKFSTFETDCLNCRRCGLCSTRTNVVIGSGNPESQIMFVGEGPGEKEDLSGEAFVGPAGQLLDDYLSLIGLDRSMIYIANIVKCRPPMNRDPSREECSACRVWLDLQMEKIDPLVIICLGRIAAKELINQDFRITKDHGKWFYVGGRKMIATYHPSALLRDVEKRPEAFADFREIRRELREMTGNAYPALIK